MKVSKLKHIIITSMIFVAIIFFIVHNYENKLQALPKVNIQREARVVAVRELPVGTILTQNDLIVKYFIPSEVHPDSIKNINEVLAKKVDGKNIRYKVTDRVMPNELLLSTQLLPEDKWFKDSERIYAIKFDSETTGAYNVSKDEQVDIYVLYNKSQTDEDDNKRALDILLSKRRVLDIRDDAGLSITTNQEVRPGYLVFSLTYDEIAKIEEAKRKGKLFVGKYGSVTQKSLEELMRKPTPTPTPTATPIPKKVVPPQNNIGTQTPTKTGGN